ncbi:MAG TPA: Stp1/IreP family PP2C-type Ser/Thr phosphatase [Solirubrobacteraceae bacterium]|nr:Stp1/IreP family PP2C-type Ser/Thr phosphatase [Solirubrobacteraceae bacterium]
MLRVAEQYATSDTGLQRRANEDSLLARAPLFVVADGMGGAQAGEVASRIAVQSFAEGLDDTTEPESDLAARALAANARIHELSHSNAEQAGMGTTLTAAYVAAQELAIAHVGDSRAYCLRDGVLRRLTEDHSLVDELVRQGKISAAEALDHPQRSVITRALGPEPAVEIDTLSFQTRSGDVYLLCSDGLTTMVPEERIAELLTAHPSLREAGEALIAAANQAGGRDNITVVLFRLEDPRAGAQPAGVSTVPAPPAAAAEAPTGEAPPFAEASERAPLHSASAASVTALATPQPASVRRRRPRLPGSGEDAPAARKRARIRHARMAAVALVVFAMFAAGAYVALQSIYFVGTNSRGLITLYQGVPYQLPFGIKLYNAGYVSGVTAASLPPPRRRTVLDHTLRSENDAEALVRSLELGALGE